MLIYKIANSDDWLEAIKSGSFEGTPKDKEDGFIHFSTGEQLVRTLKRHYRHFPDHMLAISSVDADGLGDALKWEPAQDGDLFPHLYAPLSRDAVRETVMVFYFSLEEEDFATIHDFVAEKGIFEKS